MLEEYKQMYQELTEILADVADLPDKLGLKSDIDKLALIKILITDGYLSRTGTHVTNTTISDLETSDELIFNLALTAITGTGCCRHVSALTKLLLDSVDVENEIACALNITSGIDTNLLLEESENNKHVLVADHTINIMKVDDKSIGFNFSPGSRRTYFYQLKDNIATGIVSDRSYLFYNYSPFFEGRKAFDDIVPLELAEHDYILRGCNNTCLALKADRSLLEEFYQDNKAHMVSINNSYQKILVRK